MGIRWPYKWGKRFNDNLSPKKGDRGFDGIPNGVGAYDAKIKERWGCLASRIAEHGCFSRSYYPFPLSPTLPAQWLAWNKNPQCPPDIWKNMSVSLVPMSKKSFKGLAVQRHSKVKSTLDNINHIELSFSINNDIDLGYGFWLIDDQYKDFVYAILKSSMFRAWCELTAATDVHIGKNGKKYQEQGHFTVGMWDTFPLPKLTNSRKSLIITAGQELQEGYRWGQKKLDKSVDSLFAPTCSIHVLSDRCRKRILAEGFLDAFYGL